MSEQTIDLNKRRFLTKATGVVGAVGFGFRCMALFINVEAFIKSQRLLGPLLMLIFQSLSQGSLFVYYGEKNQSGYLKEMKKLLKSLILSRWLII